MTTPKRDELPDEEIIAIAMETGFSVSTAYGQGPSKLMPISDGETLIQFARKIKSETTTELMALAEMVVLWNNGLRHKTAQESAMVKKAQAALAAHGGK